MPKVHSVEGATKIYCRDIGRPIVTVPLFAHTGQILRGAGRHPTGAKNPPTGRSHGTEHGGKHGGIIGYNWRNRAFIRGDAVSFFVVVVAAKQRRGAFCVVLCHQHKSSHFSDLQCARAHVITDLAFFERLAERLFESSAGLVKSRVDHNGKTHAHSHALGEHLHNTKSRNRFVRGWNKKRVVLISRKIRSKIVTVQYLGIKGTMAEFARSGVVIDSGATTMNSTPLIIPNTQTTYTNGSLGGVPVTATSTTYGSPTVIPAHPPNANFLPQGEVMVDVDLAKQKSFLVAGNQIEIIDATPTSLTYRIVHLDSP